MKILNLPKWQYTFREVSSGTLFLGFANQLTSHEDFMDKANTYQLFFNLKRPDSYTKNLKLLGNWLMKKT